MVMPGKRGEWSIFSCFFSSEARRLKVESFLGMGVLNVIRLGLLTIKSSFELKQLNPLEIKKLSFLVYFAIFSIFEKFCFL